MTNEDGGKHTKWLNFMAPRLYMLWQLLHDERGVIFVSINDVELFRLGMLLNEIFGPENWVGTLVWKATTDNNPTRIAIEHEYILCYAKSKERLPSRWTNPDNEVKAMMIDPTGKYILNEKLRTKLLYVPAPLKIALITKGKLSSSYSSIADDGWSLLRFRTGMVAPENFDTLEDLTATLVQES